MHWQNFVITWGGSTVRIRRIAETLNKGMGLVVSFSLGEAVVPSRGYRDRTEIKSSLYEYNAFWFSG